MKAVVSVIEMFEIRSIADVPCGDGCFAAGLLGAVRNRSSSAAIGISAAHGRAPLAVVYTGIDIVRSLVERNQAQLGDEMTRFMVADVVGGATPLPAADLIFSRQMLQHLCTEDALRFVRLVARSSARFALLSTFKTDDSFANTDIPCTSGGYRPQDLTKPPFSLPAPLALFDEMYPIDRRISLGLWRVGALRHRLL